MLPRPYVSFLDGLVDIALNSTSPPDIRGRAARTVMATPDTVGFGPGAEVEARLYRAMRRQPWSMLGRSLALSLLEHVARIGRPLDFGIDGCHECYRVDPEQRRLVPLSHDEACTVWSELTELLEEPIESHERLGVIE